MRDETIKKVAEAIDLLMKEGLHTKTPASSNTATLLHGPTGLFGTSGIERDVVTAMVRPQGIGAILPLLPSVDTNPFFAAITGISDDIGNEPTEACEDAPTGYMKSCLLTAAFGMIRRDTETIEMDKVMLRVNRGDFTDLVLRGRMLGLTNLEPSGLDEGRILDVVTMSEMVNAAVRVERELSRQIWQGTPSIANQFPGLDVQIATGQKDAKTNTACPALDSDVKNFNYQLINEDIVEYLSSLEWYLTYLDNTTGVAPVERVVVMNPGLWYELSAIWPCAYNTNRCAGAVSAGATTFIDGRENVAERDAMRNGMYIDINGRRYRVVVDTGIYEKNSTNSGNLAPGEFASSIYMVPLTIQGNFPVTYREYVDYRRAQPDVSLLRGMETFFWTDNGVYSWAIESTKWCYKLAVKTEQRVVLRTPHLAGRIDNIKYTPLQHLREPYPDSPYWSDGGVSLRSNVGTTYAVWK